MEEGGMEEGDDQAMPRLNCWEFRKCGRETGGANTTLTGPCPASTETAPHRVHGGINAGRACWAVAGIFGPGDPQDPLSHQMKDCEICDFYLSVLDEEGEDFDVRFDMCRLHRIKG